MIKNILEYITNLCYSLFRRISEIFLGFIGVIEMKERERGILDAKKLAGYISNKYKNAKKYDISPIKLQKALYFLFAYWGGIIRKSKNNPDYVEENLSTQNEILFDNEIEAWVYGPVVPEVYREKNISSFYEDGENIFEGNTFLEETINSILEDLFEVPDFKLVSISHDDKCWQDKFNPEEMMHNNEILKEDIIKEYAAK